MKEDEFKCVLKKPKLKKLRSKTLRISVPLLQVHGFDENGPNGINFIIPNWKLAKLK